MDTIAGRLAPQFGGGETHPIEALGVFAAEMSVGVGQHMDAVVTLDDADVAAGVAGQAGVTGWIEVAGADLIADPEPGGSFFDVSGRRAAPG